LTTGAPITAPASVHVFDGAFLNRIDHLADTFPTISMLLALIATAATKQTVWEKIQAVPKETWISTLIAIGIIIILVRIWKSLAEINEIVPWIALVTVGGTVVLYWTYERTEPKFLSPIFDELAKILPSRIKY
jgi:hypothetical protein